MGRQPRDYSQGNIFHVFQRGNNREFLFKSDESKGMLIHLFKEFRTKFDYEILGFVIMDNHYHIIIKPNKDPLDKIMFYINNLYAKYINKTQSRWGHVFESRYNCKIVDTESYLLWLLRYIHRNPIRANIVNHVNDYFWSSHYFYKNSDNDTVNTNFVLNTISNKRPSAILVYMKYMTLTGDDQNKEEDYKILSGIMEQKLRDDLININHNIMLNKRESIEAIAHRIFKDADLTRLIILGSKQRHLTPLKIEFIEKARAQRYSLKEIANYLKSAESSISYLLTRNKKV